jgi:Right handed beta helix region/Protein of unknown function (DUF1565)
LNVNDFGCVPDGRVLERVSTASGSADLTALDGTLRASDVGKNIAIPGAADLVASVTGLLDRKDVPNAAMGAASPILTAALPPGEGFRADLHKGLRVTVEGAGLGGATLLGDVLEVVDKSTLRLSEAASTAVTNAKAILNRPDRVALSDYARASVEGLAVALPGRTVSDAAMTIGQRGLNSASAKFSSLDLGALVTIRAAGFLVTTIQSFTSDTKVRLATPAQRAVANGPADVWKTDSRPGFESALAALANREVEAAEIVFDAGVYDFTRVPAGTPKITAAVGLLGLRNVTLRGSGQGGTVLRLMPAQDLSGPDTHVVQMRECANLTLRDLSVHGAYLTMAAVNEQMHGIQLNAGCDGIVVERVRVFQSAGDGIRFLGDGQTPQKPAVKVRRVWVQDCSFVQNKRTGVAFQRAAEFVWVQNCYIEMTPPSTDACVDFEPSGNTAPSDVIIDSNVLVHNTPATAVSISGIRGDDPTRRVRFVNNTLTGGGIEGVDAQDVTLAENMISAGSRGPIVTCRGNYDRLRIERNKIVATGATRPAIVVAFLDRFAPSGAWINDNHIETPGDGISLIDPGSNFEIRGNRIFGGGAFAGIRVRLGSTTLGVHRAFKISGNTIANFGKVGIQFATFNTSERFEGVAIEGNEIFFDGQAPAGAAGIALAKPGNGTARWLVNAVVAENRIGDNIELKLDRDRATVPFVAVAGNPASRAVFEGDGSPEGLVPAPPGSLYLRVDSDSETALFLKQAGDGATGWIAILTGPVPP